MDKSKKPPVKLTDKQIEALNKGRKTFKQGEARTKEFGSAGGKKSGELRQEKAQARTFAAILAEELNVINEKTGEPRKNGVAKKLVEAMERAKPKEAAKLFEVLRDTLGEAPAQKVDLNATGNVNIGNWRDVLPGSGAAVNATATPTATATDEAKTDAGRTETDSTTETPTATAAKD